MAAYTCVDKIYKMYDYDKKEWVPISLGIHRYCVANYV